MLRALAWLATVALVLTAIGTICVTVIAYRHPELGLRNYVVGGALFCAVFAPLVGQLWAKGRARSETQRPTSA